jgi:hypothetical protein
MLKIGFSSITHNCLTGPSCWNLQKAEGVSFATFFYKKKKKHNESFAPLKKIRQTQARELS